MRRRRGSSSPSGDPRVSGTPMRRPRRRRPPPPRRSSCRPACVPAHRSLGRRRSRRSRRPRIPKTLSPTLNSVTAAPTASTSPASSLPRILRFGRRRPVKKREMNDSALRSPQSLRLTVEAWILTRTSSSLGTGRSTSSSRSTSGGPYLSYTTALISSPSVFSSLPSRGRMASRSQQVPEHGCRRPLTRTAGGAGCGHARLGVPPWLRAHARADGRG